MWVQEIVFYAASTLIVLCSLMVITSRNTVRSALFLVSTFVSTAVLWLLLEAEFLALALIFVYVGAVMTLFLFVVMMLNVELEPMKKTFVRYAPLGIFVSVMVLVLMINTLSPEHFNLAKYAKPFQAPADYSNVKSLGAVLYTKYMYPFEVAGVLLLVAIIAAIGLALPGKRQRKNQIIDKQVRTKRNERVRLLNMPTERGH